MLIDSIFSGSPENIAFPQTVVYCTQAVTQQAAVDIFPSNGKEPVQSPRVTLALARFNAFEGIAVPILLGRHIDQEWEKLPDLRVMAGTK